MKSTFLLVLMLMVAFVGRSQTVVLRNHTPCPVTFRAYVVTPGTCTRTGNFVTRTVPSATAVVLTAADFLPSGAFEPGGARVYDPLISSSCLPSATCPSFANVGDPACGRAPSACASFSTCSACAGSYTQVDWVFVTPTETDVIANP